MNKGRKAFISGRSIALILLALLALCGLYLISRNNYLLFHSLAEAFSIVVAGGIFVIFWNSRRFLGNGYFLFLGIAYLFVGGLDLLHTLAYAGMGVFPEYGANLPTQLWIAARYVESLSLFAAPFLLHRRTRPYPVLIGYAVLTALLLGSIFYWNLFPDCFVEGIGLTSFKKASEYIISLILAASIVLLARKREEFDPGVFRLLTASIVVTIVSEMAFTLYVHVYGLPNLLGHILKVVSVYLVYKAFIETGLTKPFDLLFRDLKRSEEALRKSEERFRSLIENSSDIISILEADGTIRYQSPSIERVLGYKPEELIGQPVLNLVHPDDLADMTSGFIGAVQTAGTVQTSECRYRHKDGSWRIIEATSHNLLQDPAVGGLVVNSRDTTERKQAERQIQAALAEKEVLLKEVHHRVKNNLQALIYLIDMQAETTKDPEILRTLTELQGRVRATAMIHERLYRAEDLAQIDFAAYLQDLITYLAHALRGDRPISLRVGAENILINVNLAIPCGLIVNELVTNALEHAFPDAMVVAGRLPPPAIMITFAEQEGNYELTVSDNGVGLPADLDWRTSESLGLKLVNIWATYQLGGSIEVGALAGPDPGRTKGTTFKLRFPRGKDLAG